MERLGARRDRIVAVLGPSIGRANYEVGPEFVDRFIEADAGQRALFRAFANAGHAMFDLNRYTVDRLVRRRRDAPRRSTAAPMPRKICSISYRRTTHRKRSRTMAGRFRRSFWRNK